MSPKKKLYGPKRHDIRRQHRQVKPGKEECMMDAQETADRLEFLMVAPPQYHKTMDIEWVFPHRAGVLVQAQRMESDLENEEDVWVIVPTR